MSGTGSAPATFNYTPDADYSGSDSFTVEVADGNGGTDTIVVDVDVTEQAEAAPPAAASGGGGGGGGCFLQTLGLGN